MVDLERLSFRISVHEAGGAFYIHPLSSECKNRERRKDKVA